MTAYNNGGDPEEALRAGCTNRDWFGSPNHHVLERSTSSFTPNNNHDWSRFQVEDSRKTLRRGIDSDALYEIPEDTTQDDPRPNGRKRPAITVFRPGRGHPLALGRGSEYNNDEEDTAEQSHGIVFEISPTKRRKPVSLNSLLPMKSSLNAQALTRERDENGGAESETCRLEYIQHNLQRITPPDTLKETKRRSISTVCNSKLEQQELFQIPSNPRPLTLRRKQRSEEAPQPQSVSNYQGWKTTEDVVKLTPIKLAKTTLENLAAFRYKGDSIASLKGQSADTCLAPEEYVMEESVTNVSQDNLSPHPSSDDDLISNNHMLIDGAFLNDKNGNEPISDANITSGNVSTYSYSDHESARDNSSLVKPMMGTHLVSNEHLQSGLMLHRHLSTTGKDERSATEVFHPISEYCEPTSGEAGNDSNAMDWDAVKVSQASVEVPQIQVPSEMMNNSQLYLDIRLQEHEREVAFLGPSEPSDQLKGISRRLQTNDLPVINISTDGNCARESTSILDYNSNKPHRQSSELSVAEGSKDFSSTDEFDEGIADDELLGLVSDAIIFDTPALSLMERQNSNLQASHNQLDLQLQTAVPDISESSISVVDRTASQRAVIWTTDDDDFPTDFGDEEELLKLLDIENGVKETFSPPNSLQYAFDDESITREVYDNRLKFSPLKSQGSEKAPMVAGSHSADSLSARKCIQHPQDPRNPEPMSLAEPEDWTFIHSKTGKQDMDATEREASGYSLQQVRIAKESVEALLPAGAERRNGIGCPKVEMPVTLFSPGLLGALDDRHEYLPLQPFARPDFPAPMRDRSPVIGLSAQIMLRSCFRIGEMLKEGARCNLLGLNVVIELFARVTFSSRETRTTKQHFQFADLFHDRPPFPSGFLTNYKSSHLAESESKAFIGGNGENMARCLGQLKRDLKSREWTLHIIHIRETDWEEIRWTKRIICGDRRKAQAPAKSTKL